jgi:HK97 family phage major capsid protein
MDPELKKALEELREKLGKNVEALTRVDAIETAATQAGADIKLLRTQLETIEKANADREKTIVELQRAGRLQAIQRDGGQDRRYAVEMLGMLTRQLLCRQLKREIPARFAPETELVRAWENEHIARATLAADAVTGSYLVPTITEAQLIDTLEEMSELLGKVEFIPGLPAAGTIYMPTLTGRPTLQPARATTDTKMSQTDPTFGLLELTPKEAYIYFPVDNHLIEMSVFALGQWINGLMREWMIGGICDWLLNADGTAAYNSMTGILEESTAAYLYSLPAGKMAFADLAKSDLTAIKKQSLKRGRARGVWLMALDVEGIVEDMEREGKAPVITYDPAGNSRILKNPVINDEGMPDLAQSKKDTPFIAYGDLATMIVGLQGGFKIASDQSERFGYNQTSFRAIVNMVLKRKPVKTLILAKTAAA